MPECVYNNLFCRTLNIITMKAAVLHENQKNQTLSAKKQKNKKINVARNVFASTDPEMKFRFLGYALSKEECIQFEENLLQFYTYKPEFGPKWCELKNYTKEQRRELKKPRDTSYRSYMALGFNDATKLVENKKATVVILAGDITPAILNKHFYRCCELYNIPLLKVQNLKEISKKCFGFSTMTMAFKDVPENSLIYSFYKYLQTFSSKMNYTIQPQPKPKKINVNTPNSSNKESEKKKKNKVNGVFRNILLKRPDPNTRSFVPEARRPKKFNDDFIPFQQTSKGQDKIFPFKKNTLQQLKSIKVAKLRVKRLQKNPNRQKHEKKQ